jgi:hypothetical protein
MHGGSQTQGDAKTKIVNRAIPRHANKRTTGFGAVEGVTRSNQKPGRKTDSSHPQADRLPTGSESSIARASREEEASACSVRNDRRRVSRYVGAPSAALRTSFAPTHKDGAHAARRLESD